MCFFNETDSDESRILLHHYLDTIIAGHTKLSFWLIRSQENATPPNTILSERNYWERIVLLSLPLIFFSNIYLKFSQYYQ